MNKINNFYHIVYIDYRMNDRIQLYTNNHHNRQHTYFYLHIPYKQKFYLNHNLIHNFSIQNYNLNTQINLFRKIHFHNNKNHNDQFDNFNHCIKYKLPNNYILDIHQINIFSIQDHIINKFNLEFHNIHLYNYKNQMN